MDRLQEIVGKGSHTFEYSVPAINHGSTLWLHMYDIFPQPQARAFMPFDWLEVINNSAVLIGLYFGSKTEIISIPSYMIKPIAQRSYMQFGLYNEDAAVDTNAGDVLIHCRRLPPDVQVVVSGGTIR
jgi:hypothetical protein